MTWTRSARFRSRSVKGERSSGVECRMSRRQRRLARMWTRWVQIGRELTLPNLRPSFRYSSTWCGRFDHEKPKIPPKPVGARKTNQREESSSARCCRGDGDDSMWSRIQAITYNMSVCVCKSFFRLGKSKTVSLSDESKTFLLIFFFNLAWNFVNLFIVRLCLVRAIIKVFCCVIEKDTRFAGFQGKLHVEEEIA